MPLSPLWLKSAEPISLFLMLEATLKSIDMIMTATPITIAPMIKFSAEDMISIGLLAKPRAW